MAELTKLEQKIQRCWSRDSASTYTLDNPALGQCSVTALLLQDQLGGNILKTNVNGAWHFYNLVDGQRVDLTASQFGEPPVYDDLPSSREDAFSDTTPEQYRALCIAYERTK